MTKILAIDTSTDACSAALLIDDKIADRFVVASKQYTKLILPMIDELLVEAQLDLDQLDAIAFGAGPGSFTGVRLAASIVQGLSFAADIPVVKISTLHAIAQEAYVELKISRLLVVQDARMEEVYCGEYQADEAGIMQAVWPNRIMKPEELSNMVNEKTVGAGNGFEAYRDIFVKNHNISVIDKSYAYAQAKYVAQLAEIDFAKGIKVVSEDALPIYLRDKVAKESSGS